MGGIDGGGAPGDCMGASGAGCGGMGVGGEGGGGAISAACSSKLVPRRRGTASLLESEQVAATPPAHGKRTVFASNSSAEKAVEEEVGGSHSTKSARAKQTFAKPSAV